MLRANNAYLFVPSSLPVVSRGFEYNYVGYLLISYNLYTINFVNYDMIWVNSLSPTF